MQRRLIVFALSALCASSAPTDAEAIYRQRCAGCHELTSPRIPHRTTLQKMSARRILRSLDFGAMMNVAYPMTRTERESVSRWLGTSAGAEGPLPAAFCADRRVRLDPDASRWNGWSPDAGNTRSQTASSAKLTAEGVRRLRLKWAFGHEGDVNAFSQPTVIGDTLFTGSASGAVYALDAATGCIRWVFQANGPVRMATLAIRDGKSTHLAFGDQVGWVYAIDALTGELRWKKKADEHEATRLTGSAVAHDGVLFVPVASWEETRALNSAYECCTFRGSVVALRVKDGEPVWKTYTVPPVQQRENGWGPSGAGIWSAPTIDAKRGLVYVATGDNYSSPATETSDAVLALDLKSGRIVWSRQFTVGDVFNSRCLSPAGACPPEKGPDHDFGASVMLVGSGGRELLVAGQKSGMVYALDPERGGETVWKVRAGRGGLVGGVQWGMAAASGLVFAAVSDAVTQPVKSAVFRKPDARPSTHRRAEDYRRSASPTAQWRGSRRRRSATPDARIAARGNRRR